MFASACKCRFQETYGKIADGILARRRREHRDSALDAGNSLGKQKMRQMRLPHGQNGIIANQQNITGRTSMQENFAGLDSLAADQFRFFVPAGDGRDSE